MSTETITVETCGRVGVVHIDGDDLHSRGEIGGAPSACGQGQIDSPFRGQEGAGGGTPSPRNDNAASDKTAPAIPRLACTINGWMAFGKI